MTKETQIAKSNNEAQPLTGRPTTMNSDMVLYDDAMFDRMWRISEIIAKRSMTPHEFRDKPDDVFAVVVKSKVWGIDPFQVFEQVHVQQGKVGYSSQLCTTLINKFAPTKDRLHLEWFGDWGKIIGKVKEMTGKTGGKYYVADWPKNLEEGLGVKVWATLKCNTEPTELTLELKQCYPRFSTQWATDPKQQIGYLAQRKWCRLHASDVLMGVYTPDEMAEYDMTVESLPVGETVTTSTATVIEEPDETDPATAESIDKLKELLANPHVDDKTRSAWLDKINTAEDGALTVEAVQKSIAKFQAHIRKAEKEAAKAPEAPAPEQEPAETPKAQEKPDTAKQQAIKAMHAAGVELYGDNWDDNRARLVKGVNKSKKSSKDLTIAEIQEVIRFIEIEKEEDGQ